jgi:hypothetical protein|tara:strand:+ start:145 stop:534 length:390 start_codon:yes stop_codon:yes gene_type:complete
MAEGFGKDIQTSSTKVSQLRKALAVEGAEDADLIMMNILQIFNETDLVPDAGKFYTFIYQAKTPRLEYDEHPLVAVTEVFRWGFKGYNYHWRQMRQYTWAEVVGSLHIVRENEVRYLSSLPYGKKRINN